MTGSQIISAIGLCVTKLVPFRITLGRLSGRRPGGRVYVLGRSVVGGCFICSKARRL